MDSGGINLTPKFPGGNCLKMFDNKSALKIVVNRIGTWLIRHLKAYVLQMCKKIFFNLTRPHLMLVFDAFEAG